LIVAAVVLGCFTCLRAFATGQRLIVVDSPVSYVGNATTRQMQLHDNCGSNLTQLDGCSLNYHAGCAQPGGLLSILVTIADASGASVTPLHQV
jgi:hypothetical protein